jgi:hypothetical protein
MRVRPGVDRERIERRFRSLRPVLVPRALRWVISRATEPALHACYM